MLFFTALEDESIASIVEQRGVVGFFIVPVDDVVAPEL